MGITPDPLFDTDSSEYGQPETGSWPEPHWPEPPTAEIRMANGETLGVWRRSKRGKEYWWCVNKEVRTICFFADDEQLLSILKGERNV